MAKKNFIRGLEYYGFPDQNGYSSTMNSVDLSEIIQKNKEQDEKDKEHDSEIEELTEDKANKSDLDSLSGKVDTLISAQTEINHEIIESIEDIDERMDKAEDNIETLSGDVITINSAITDLNDSLETLAEEFHTHVDDLKDYVDGQISGVTERIDSVEDILSGKLDTTVAEETYAKKGDSYTKEEADEIFLKEHQDISHLATKEEVQELREEVEAINLDEYAKQEDLNRLSGEVDTFKSETTEEFNNVNNDINAVSALTEELQGKIDEKVDTTAFTQTVGEIDTQIHNLDVAKADKTTLYELSGNVIELGDSLAAEAVLRQEGDDALYDELNALDDKINAVDAKIDATSGDIQSIRDDLNQEIQDRQNADIALIGTSGDSQFADTIWGAKNYGDFAANQAVESAKTYTDDKFSGIDTKIDNKFDEFDTRLSAKADKTYVDELVDDRITASEETINNRIDNEVAVLEQADDNLATEIENVKNMIVTSADTKEIYKRINVITTYEGDTPEEYIDTGNGILDVMHRELHQFEEEMGYEPNPTLEKNNLHEVAFGNYNVSNTGPNPSDQTIFSIGIGTSEEDRKNAIEIRNDGTVLMWVEGDFLNINDLLSMLAHETYN